MQKTCYVHIGMHQTGSSSIQETLNSNFSDPEFRYVKLNGANHSSDMISLFSDSPENNHNYKKRGLSIAEIQNLNVNIRNALIENFTGSNATKFIISGEGITHLNVNELTRLKSFLCEFFDKIVIVGYIRPAWSYMESTFQQQLKGTLNRFHLPTLYPQYRQRFEKFDFVFGIDNVYLWKFDPERFVGGDVVFDFCKRLNIQNVPEQSVKVNETISKEAASLLFIYRKFGPGYGIGPTVIRENDQMILSLATIGNTQLRFASELVSPVLEANCDDIDWMEARIGKPLREVRVDNESDIVSELSLLDISPSTLQELIKIVGDQHLPSGLKGETPKEISILIDVIRKNNVWRKKNEETAANKTQIEVTHKGHPHVLEGKENFLFLVGGNHSIKKFFTGELQPSDESIANFTQNIIYRDKICTELGITFKHFVFPDKIYALRKKISFQTHSVFRKYYANSNDALKGKVMYLDFNNENSENYFLKTDTHYNFYGNLLVTGKILHELGVHLNDVLSTLGEELQLEYHFIGDLGAKLSPPGVESIVKPRSFGKFTFDTNGIVGGNNGILDILSNPEAAIKQRLLIFGDSYFRSLLPFLARFFTEVIFCRSQFFHCEVVQRCHPQVILSGNAERYLSVVEKDERRDDFFLLPLLNSKKTSPTENFGSRFKKIFQTGFEQ